MKTQKKTLHKRTPARNVGGRPARPMPGLIPDAPEAIVRACMAGPPKKQWQYTAPKSRSWSAHHSQ